MKPASFLPLLLLFACTERDPAAEEKAAVAEQKSAAKASEDGIDCAVGGEQAFERACLVERDDGGTLTIRHPDGGFRRLLITEDGRGVMAADGAAPTQVQVVGGNIIEVTVEEDRYRLPATIKSGQPPAR
jgi:hypothetical protein